jgi:hypothetical protein
MFKSKCFIYIIVISSYRIPAFSAEFSIGTSFNVYNKNNNYKDKKTDKIIPQQNPWCSDILGYWNCVRACTMLPHPGVPHVIIKHCVDSCERIHC